MSYPRKVVAGLPLSPPPPPAIAAVVDIFFAVVDLVKGNHYLSHSLLAGLPIGMKVLAGICVLVALVVMAVFLSDIPGKC